ncbi:hypothetical protein [Terriglobus sp.]|uniref:hypothetical protein n=1 Tax=Terriglobus sp. TaxID=1889013 RepID=UPI003AFFBD9F
MRMNTFAAFTLAAALATGTLAAQTENQDQRKLDQAQAKIDHKADQEAAKLNSGSTKKAYKEQAHADKHTAKALGTHEAKKAAKDQDKANAKADAAGLPQ